MNGRFESKSPVLFEGKEGKPKRLKTCFSRQKKPAKRNPQKEKKELFLREKKRDIVPSDSLKTIGQGKNGKRKEGRKELRNRVTGRTRNSEEKKRTSRKAARVF